MGRSRNYVERKIQGNCIEKGTWKKIKLILMRIRIWEWRYERKSSFYKFTIIVPVSKISDPYSFFSIGQLLFSFTCCTGQYVTWSNNFNVSSNPHGSLFLLIFHSAYYVKQKYFFEIPRIEFPLIAEWCQKNISASIVQVHDIHF